MDTPMQIPPGHVAKAVMWERWSVDGAGGHVPPAPLCPVTACAWGGGGALVTWQEVATMEGRAHKDPRVRNGAGGRPH